MALQHTDETITSRDNLSTSYTNQPPQYTPRSVLFSKAIHVNMVTLRKRNADGLAAPIKGATTSAASEFGVEKTTSTSKKSPAEKPTSKKPATPKTSGKRVSKSPAKASANTSKKRFPAKQGKQAKHRRE